MPSTDLENDRDQRAKSAAGASSEIQPGPPAQRGKFWIIGLVVLVLVVGLATYFWLSGRNRESTDDATVDGHLAQISAKVTGQVLEVLVNDNQQVKAGQVILRLDPRDYQSRVDQLQAALAVAQSQARAAEADVPLIRSTTASGTSGSEAQLAAAQAQAEQAKVAAQQAATSSIANAEANVGQAEANNRKAQADLERMRPLITKEEISKQQFDSYSAASQVAAAQLKSAQEQLNGARQEAQNAQAAVQSAQAKVAAAQAGVQQSRAGQQQVQVSAAQALSARSQIQQAQANLNAAQLQLSYATIVAPVDGVITQKSVEPGQNLQPGQALMTIVPLHDVWVTANFKETQLANVHPGDLAEVKVDMYGRKISGRVDSIAGASGSKLSLLPPENATGNFVKVVQRIPVKIVFDQLPGDVILRPGMNVDATILTK